MQFNVKVKALNEYTKLSERLSFNKLVKLVIGAKKFGFDPKKFAWKLSNMKQLEKREKWLRGNCAMFSKEIDKYKETLPLAQIIWDMHIDKSKLISFKIAINEVVETYGLTPSAASPSCNQHYKSLQ